MTDYRKLGKTCLKLVLKNTKNIDTFENNTFKLAKNEEEYKEIITQIVLQVKNKISLKEILQTLKKGKYIWNSDTFENIKYSIEEQDNFIVKPFEIDEGVMECTKCGSKKTYSYTKQTRGGDEATTVFAICSNCNARWKT